MCGRYAITLPPDAVRAVFDYVDLPNFPPRYNIAPTQPIPIVLRDRDSADRAARRFRLVRWGFVPAFARDFARRPIVNARGEELVDKPSFRNAFRRRRCLVIADGFYEWQRYEGEAAQPYLIRRADGGPFGMAGLTEPWIGADGSEIETACIITAAANGPLSGIHARMPVIIDPADMDLWLDLDERSAGEAAALMRPAPDDLLTATAIGTGVNKVVNDDAWIQEPVTPLREAPPKKPKHAEDTPAQGSLF